MRASRLREGSALGGLRSVAYEAKYGEPNDTIFTATGYDIIKVDCRCRRSGRARQTVSAIRDAWDNLENVEVATGTMTYKGQDRVPVRVVALNRVNNGLREHVGDFSPDPSQIPAP